MLSLVVDLNAAGRQGFLVTDSKVDFLYKSCWKKKKKKKKHLTLCLIQFFKNKNDTWKVNDYFRNYLGQRFFYYLFLATCFFFAFVLWMFQMISPQLFSIIYIYIYIYICVCVCMCVCVSVCVCVCKYASMYVRRGREREIW